MLYRLSQPVKRRCVRSTESIPHMPVLTLIDSYLIPTWLSDEGGALTHKRVWKDLVKRLETKGHSIDVGGLSVKKTTGVQ